MTSASGKTRGQSAAAGRLTAATVDPHVLYEASVQSTDFELDFLRRVYRAKRGRGFSSLREDFCGTAALACDWVRRGADHTAVGVDLDRPTLEWGAANHVARLGPAARRRVRLVRDNVLHVSRPRVDAIVAFNYSYSVFKERDLLRRYFRNAWTSLARDGILCVDAFGGTAATDEGIESRRVGPLMRNDGRKVPRFTYQWDQVRFNPVTHEILCHMHFRFSDGTRLTKAFVYDWRFWTLPELQETMREAGFRSVDVHVEGWDDERNEADGIFRKRRSFTNIAGWVAYVVGFK